MNYTISQENDFHYHVEIGVELDSNDISLISSLIAQEFPEMFKSEKDKDYLVPISYENGFVALELQIYIIEIWSPIHGHATYGGMSLTQTEYFYEIDNAEKFYANYKSYSEQLVRRYMITEDGGVLFGDFEDYNEDDGVCFRQARNVKIFFKFF